MRQTALVARMPCERTTGRYGTCVVAAPGQMAAWNKATQERGIGNAAMSFSASEREERRSRRRGRLHAVPNALCEVRIRCDSQALDACTGGFGLDLGGPWLFPACRNLLDASEVRQDMRKIEVVRIQRAAQPPEHAASTGQYATRAHGSSRPPNACLGRTSDELGFRVRIRIARRGLLVVGRLGGR